MPAHAVKLLADAMGGSDSLRGKKVVVLGISYRGGVKESAFSGVFGTVAALKERGAVVVVHDPMYSDVEISALGFTPFHLGEDCDAVILQADHKEYKERTINCFVGVKAIVDGRRTMNRANFPGVVFRVIGAGA